jgi:hypothetical protein
MSNAAFKVGNVLTSRHGYGSETIGRYKVVGLVGKATVELQNLKTLTVFRCRGSEINGKPAIKIAFNEYAFLESKS